MLDDATAPRIAKPKPLKIKGKVVKPDRWELAVRVLASFNEQTSRKLRPLTSAEQPSDAATRIYGRIEMYPDLTYEKHVDIIRRTVASKWWGSETPVPIGVVYGPKVFEENITRSGTVKGAAAAAENEAAAERLRKLTEMRAAARDAQPEIVDAQLVEEIR